jgi:hypothetical protein
VWRCGLDGVGSGCSPEMGSCERRYTNYVMYGMENVNAHYLALNYIQHFLVVLACQ